MERNTITKVKLKQSLVKTLTGSLLVFILHFVIPLIFLVPPVSFIFFIPFDKLLIPVFLGSIYFMIANRAYKNDVPQNFLLVSIFSILSALLAIVVAIISCELAMLITCNVYSLLTASSILSICLVHITFWGSALIAKFAVQKLKAIDLYLILGLLVVGLVSITVPAKIQEYETFHRKWGEISDQKESERIQKSKKELAEKHIQHSNQMAQDFPKLDQFHILPYDCNDKQISNTFITDDQRFILRFDSQYLLWENDYHTHNFHLKENNDTVLSVSHTPDLYDFGNFEQALEVVLSGIKEEYMKFLDYKSNQMNRTIYEITSPSGVMSYYLSHRGSINTQYDRNMRALVKVDDKWFQIWDGFTYEEKGNGMFRDILCSLEPLNITSN